MGLFLHSTTKTLHCVVNPPIRAHLWPSRANLCVEAGNPPVWLQFWPNQPLISQYWANTTGRGPFPIHLLNTGERLRGNAGNVHIADPRALANWCGRPYELLLDEEDWPEPLLDEEGRPEPVLDEEDWYHAWPLFSVPVAWQLVLGCGVWHASPPRPCTGLSDPEALFECNSSRTESGKTPSKFGA